MEAFASVEDYRRLYAEDTTDDTVLAEYLLNATDVMCAAMDEGGVEYTDTTESFTFRLMRVCRDVVHRAIGVASGNLADVPFGATELSQAADTFSSGVKFSNPMGDMYLTAQERSALGIGESRVAVISPYGG